MKLTFPCESRLFCALTGREAVFPLYRAFPIYTLPHVGHHTAANRPALSQRRSVLSVCFVPRPTTVRSRPYFPRCWTCCRFLPHFTTAPPLCYARSHHATISRNSLSTHHPKSRTNRLPPHSFSPGKNSHPDFPHKSAPPNFTPTALFPPIFPRNHGKSTGKETFFKARETTFPGNFKVGATFFSEKSRISRPAPPSVLPREKGIPKGKKRVLEA